MVNSQRPTANGHPLSVNRQWPSVNGQPSSVIRQPSTVNGHPSTEKKAVISPFQNREYAQAEQLPLEYGE
jgi:hypothetical protein